MARVQTHAEWEEEMAGKILRLIRHELYLDLRFLEPALSAFAYRREEGLPALATDGATLFFSPEPLLRIFKGNAFFLGRASLRIPPPLADGEQGSKALGLSLRYCRRAGD